MDLLFSSREEDGPARARKLGKLFHANRRVIVDAPDDDVLLLPCAASRTAEEEEGIWS